MGLLGSCLLIVVLCIVLYQIGLSASSPDKTVAAFKEAVKAKNESKIVSLLNSSTDNWKFKKADASELLSYLEDHPDMKDDLFTKLDRQAESFTDDSIYMNNDETFASIHLKEDGKKWLFFHNYSLDVIPAYINITVNKDSAKIFVDNTEVETNTNEGKSKTYGPFSPGDHEIKAVLPGKYINAEEKETVALFDEKHREINKTLEIQASEVQAMTIYDDTTLYVNGEKTDVKIGKDMEEVGMLPTDGTATFKLEKEFPWGTATSEDYPVDDKFMNMEEFVAIPQDQQEELMVMLNENWKQHTAALQTGNTAKMTYAPKEYQAAVKKEAKSIKSRPKKYVATFTKARYNTDTLKTPVFNEEKNRYELKVEAEYTLHEPKLHNYALLRKGDDAITTYYMDLYFDEKEKKWKIEDYHNGSFFLTESDDLKSFDFHS